MANFAALVGTEVVNIIQPAKTLPISYWDIDEYIWLLKLGLTPN